MKYQMFAFLKLKGKVHIFCKPHNFLDRSMFVIELLAIFLIIFIRYKSALTIIYLIFLYFICTFHICIYVPVLIVFLFNKITNRILKSTSSLLLLPSWLRGRSDSSRIWDWFETLDSRMKIIQQEARPGGVTDILTIRNNNELYWQGRHKLVLIRRVRVVAFKSPYIASYIWLFNYWICTCDSVTYQLEWPN